MDRLYALFDTLRRALSWAPDWAAGAILLAAAALVALALHAALAVMLARILRHQHPLLLQLLHGTRAQTRTAFVVLALAAAAPAMPFSAAARDALFHALHIAALTLAAWAALTASRLSADAYLGRFRLDVEDNLLARKHVTQVRILKRAFDTLIVLFAVGAVLMTFDAVRQYGVSLLASAGVAGLVAGFAARPVLQNLIAGVQIAMTQPIRIGDSVVIENESGSIEEITSTYVVVRAWDMRRLIIPLSYFIERPFQNWTRESSALLGTVMLHLDYTAPVATIRAKAEELVRESPLWNGQAIGVQVSNATNTTIEVRVLVSAQSGAALWDLRCDLREKLIGFIAREHPAALPRARAAVPLDGTTPDSRNGS